MSAMQYDSEGNLINPTQSTEPLWTILRVEDSTIPNLANPAIRMKRVWFRLNDGTESYIDIPVTSLNPAAVAKLVDEQARAIESITGMSSS